MKVSNKFCILVVIYLAITVNVFGQENQPVLIERMRQLENDILDTYLEYQKLYYEDKSREKELVAFENLLTVYIGQVNEIYETLTLAQKKTETPRDIAARSLIFKALMYLEKAPLNIEYYENACYDYYEALELYKGADEPPVIYKDLPRVIQIGNRKYYRLIDILEDKGGGIHEFGKVNIAFRNFKVTANFNPRMIEIVRVNNPNQPPDNNTHEMAEPRIIDAFEEVFRKTKEIETYVALPGGTYVIRLRQGKKTNYTALTTIYVRKNQEQNYVMEPIGDWIILYEDPTSKKPDFNKFRRNQEAFELTDLTQVAEGNSFANEFDQSNGQANHVVKTSGTQTELIREIVSHYLPKFDLELLFDVNNSESKENAIQIIASSIVQYVQSPGYYNQWSLWTGSWQIAQDVRTSVNPGSPIPIGLLELIYHTLKEF